MKVEGSPCILIKATAFLDDIPPQLIETKREGSSHLSSSLGSAQPNPPSRFSTGGEAVFSQEDDQNPYKIGRRVRHTVFGFGMIKACEGSSGDRKLLIQFQNGETKRLLAKYANLELA